MRDKKGNPDCFSMAAVTPTERRGKEAPGAEFSKRNLGSDRRCNMSDRRLPPRGTYADRSWTARDEGAERHHNAVLIQEATGCSDKAAIKAAAVTEGEREGVANEYRRTVLDELRTRLKNADFEIVCAAEAMTGRDTYPLIDESATPFDLYVCIEVERLRGSIRHLTDNIHNEITTIEVSA